MLQNAQKIIDLNNALQEKDKELQTRQTRLYKFDKLNTHWHYAQMQWLMVNPNHLCVIGSVIKDLTA